MLAKAAEHVEKISRILLADLVVSECQLDEMWSFIGKKEKNLESIEKLRGELGNACVALHAQWRAQAAPLQIPCRQGLLVRRGLTEHRRG